MAPLLKNTLVSPNTAQKPKTHKHNTNWHEAAACAVQIELRDFAHLLQFHTEYVLGKNNFRIDLLIDQIVKTNQYINTDIILSFLSSVSQYK